MDVHVHRSIARGLRARGVNVLTCQDDGTTRLPDAELLARCMELDRVIVTYDQDFLSEAQRRQAEGIRFAGICYAPKRSVVIGQMIADLELLATISEPEEVANRVFFLPFR